MKPPEGRNGGWRLHWPFYLGYFQRYLLTRQRGDLQHVEDGSLSPGLYTWYLICRMPVLFHMSYVASHVALVTERDLEGMSRLLFIVGCHVAFLIFLFSERPFYSLFKYAKTIYWLAGRPLKSIYTTVTKFTSEETLTKAIIEQNELRQRIELGPNLQRVLPLSAVLFNATKMLDVYDLQLEPLVDKFCEIARHAVCICIASLPLNHLVAANPRLVLLPGLLYRLSPIIWKIFKGDRPTRKDIYTSIEYMVAFLCSVGITIAIYHPSTLDGGQDDTEVLPTLRLSKKWNWVYFVALLMHQTSAAMALMFFVFTIYRWFSNLDNKAKQFRLEVLNRIGLLCLWLWLWLSKKTLLLLGSRILALGDGKDAEPFVYEALGSAPDVFRMLHINPRLPGAPISCTLVPASLKKPLRYEAISYRWGSGDRSHPILINGRKFITTASAYAVLESKSSPFWTRSIWIDQICIDQDSRSSNEKNEQVKRMRQIYERASRVFVWLGYSEDASAAVETLRQAAILNYAPNSNSRHFILTIGRFRRFAFFQAFINLIDNLWFERMWIIQEVTVSQRVRLQYGNETFSWETLSECLELLHRNTGLLALLTSTMDIKVRRPVPRGVSNAAKMDRIRRSIADGKIISLNSLVDAFGRFEATDPRDKIYALLGIAVDERLRSAITIDYNSTTENVYWKAARYLYTCEDPLSILPLAGIGHKGRMSLLPSWIPDWTSIPMLDKLGDDQEGCYSASGTLPHRLLISESSKIMEIAGFAFDTIKSVGPVCNMLPDKKDQNWQTSETLAFSEWLLTTAWFVFGPDVRLRGLTTELGNTFWRTLIGDRTEKQHGAPAQYEKYFRAWLRQARIWRNIPTVLASDNPTQSATEAEIAEAAEASKYARLLRINQRLVCISEQGRLGLAPQGTRPRNTPGFCELIKGLSAFLSRADLVLHHKELGLGIFCA